MWCHPIDRSKLHKNDISIYYFLFPLPVLQPKPTYMNVESLEIPKVVFVHNVQFILTL